MGIAIFTGDGRGAAAPALLAALLLLGCSGAEGGGDGGAGADADADADADTDSDSDSDADAGTDCGAGDLPCCGGEPACADGWLPVDDTQGDCFCRAECTPPGCADELDVWAADFVPCGYVFVGSDLGACYAQEDLEPIDGGCGDVDDPCTTPSGYTDGVCVSAPPNTFCWRRCETASSDCDGAHHCAAQFGGSFEDFEYLGGACVPD